MTLGSVIFVSCFGTVCLLAVAIAIIGFRSEMRLERRRKLATKTKRFLKQEHREHHNSQTSAGTFRFK